MPILSHEQQQRYAEDGYLIIPGLLGDRDLEPVRRAVSRQVSREAQQLYDQGDSGSA